MKAGSAELGFCAIMVAAARRSLSNRARAATTSCGNIAPDPCDCCICNRAVLAFRALLESPTKRLVSSAEAGTAVLVAALPCAPGILGTGGSAKGILNRPRRCVLVAPDGTVFV